jgi:chorismate synthase
MNTFGRLFRISIFGESHGPAVGINIDGCPAGLKIEPEHFEEDLGRRKSGAKGTTPRIEEDKPEFISGIYNRFSTGAPVTIRFENKNVKSRDYEKVQARPRPGHADYTAIVKYRGFNDPRGGGQFSGRMTLPLVAAGVIAKKIIYPATIQAELIEAGGSKNIEEVLDKAIADKNSVGGLVECTIRGLPVGLGEPFFDSVESLISHMIFAVPGIKGIEFGGGFKAAKGTGSEYNDAIIDSSGRTKTNNTGGVSGGISNGNDIVFRVAVKPTSSIPKTQVSYDFEKDEMSEIRVTGRHDVCIALRVPVIAEAVAAIALADLKLINDVYKSFGDKIKF